MTQFGEAVSLPKFRAWLDTKEPTDTFNYERPRYCAFAQYLKEAGFAEARVGMETASLYTDIGSPLNCEHVTLPWEVRSAFKAIREEHPHEDDWQYGWVTAELDRMAATE